MTRAPAPPALRVLPDAEGRPSVLRHLAAHGVKAEYELLVIDERTGPDSAGAVLNLSADIRADLVVLGGKGTHSSIFPRAARRTRRSLAEMTAPVLTAA